MTRTTALLVALLAAACDKGGSKQEDQGGPTPSGGPGPGPGGGGGAVQVSASVRLAFGDCAAADARFESGPDPTPAKHTATGAAEPKGGTSWGTIGTGRYGTLGGPSHGTGSGYGAGSSRRASANVPQVHIGAPYSSGDLDKNIIRRYIRRQLARIKYCYEKQLVVHPGLKGTVETQFVIDGNGTVPQSQAKGVNPEVSSCVADVIRSIQFPKPKGGGMVQVKYPFLFKPTGDDDEGNDPMAAERAKAEAAERKARAAAQAAKAAAEAEARAMAEAEAKAKTAAEARAKALEEAKARGIIAQIPHEGSPGLLGGPPEPGHDNPLRAQTPAIQKCLADAGQPLGALVVDLTVADGGGVTAGATHGVNDKAAACISKAAAAARWATATAGAYRCPIAFGSQSAAAAPGIDITADAVKLGTEEVAKVAAIVADSAPLNSRIDPLYDRLITDKRKPAEEIIAITGPVVIRPVDQALMKVVNQVLYTAEFADVDVLLAALRGGTWRALREIDLPVAPVVRGTGGGKNHDAEQPPGEERVTASILITTDVLWLGLSRLGDVHKIQKVGPEHDWALLAKVLAEQKKSPFFVDRHDIEIGAEDAVVYRDVVAAIEMCNTAGFTGWAVIMPESLSTRFTQ